MTLENWQLTSGLLADVNPVAQKFGINLKRNLLSHFHILSVHS